jgi:hypothetical protein
MRIPSRFMPKYAPEASNLFQKAGCLTFGLVLVTIVAYSLWTHPVITTTVIAGIVFFSSREVKRLEARRALLASVRSHGGLCEFARSFDCRTVDTWVIRAVYEALQEEMGDVGGFSLKPTDLLMEDLGIDPDDLDLTLVPVIAKRTGRSLTNCNANPYFGRVTSLGDLVQFFNALPRQAN